MKATVLDVTERTPVEVVRLDDEDAVRRWLASAALGPACFYQIYDPDDLGSLRFALGVDASGDVAGGVLETTATAFAWLEEGDASGPERVLRADGDTVEVRGSEQVGFARLTEVVLAYLRDGERPAGRWFDAHGRAVPIGGGPWRGRRPEASGEATRALITRIAQGPRREPPLAAVLDHLGEVRDDNLRAYLFAYAHHAGAEHVAIGDFWIQEPRAVGRDLQLGILASGEPVVARRRGAIELVAPDGWRRRDFEDFVRRQGERD